VGNDIEQSPLIPRWVRYVLGSVVAIVLLWLAFRGTDWPELQAALLRLKWRYVAAGVGVMFLSASLRAWRWKHLFVGETPEFTVLLKGILTGQTLNLTLPFRSGDVARAVMIKERKLLAAGTVGVEKLLDMVFFALLCSVVPLFWVVPEWLEKPRFSVLLMGIAAVVLGLTLIVPRRTREYMRAKKAAIPALVVGTLAIWTCGAAVNWLVFRSLELQVPWLSAVVLLVILQAGVAVPSTPGRIGVLQYLAVLGLGLFGVPKADALAAGLVLHAVVFVPIALASAAIWMARD
jgi:uncharacterized membrane protein YbhN (UPF0104 family)